MFTGTVTDNPTIGARVIQLRYQPDDTAKAIIAEIAPKYGSNLYRYTVGDNELIYCDTDLLKDNDWTGAFVLWPIPNRVRGKEYEFDSQVVPLADVKRKRGNESLIHGFVDDQMWEYGEPVATDQSVSVKTWIAVTPDSPIYKYYPYESKLTLTYTLSAAGIKIDYTVENTGDKTMPFGFALHPYFATLSGTDGTLVTLPAEYIMDADEELLPSGKLIPMGSEGYDLRQPTPVGDLELDHVFTGLHDTAAASIQYPAQGLTLTLAASSDFTHMVLYTLESDKGFICFENQTGSTDMINLHAKAQKEGDAALEKAAHLLQLGPGQTHTGYIDYRIDFKS